ncbi:hypothetical protein [Embleya sp. AB8]|uniref:hypothetical protein n=1 Tax=Embleya sp. AB8 TaxID=3156304 RepID=UPI003C7944AD
MTVTGVPTPVAAWPVRSAAAAMLAGVRARAEGGGRCAAGRVEPWMPRVGLVLHTLPRAIGSRAPRTAPTRVFDIRRSARVRLDVRVSVPRMVAPTRVETVGPGGPAPTGGGPLVPVLRTGFLGPGRAAAERARATRELAERGAGHGRRIEDAGRPGAAVGTRPPAGAPGYAAPHPRAPLTFAAPARPAPAPTAPGHPPGFVDAAPRDRTGPPSPGHAATRDALTSADLPRLVDGVVREIDRRVLARQERRGWSR